MKRYFKTVDHRRNYRPLATKAFLFKPHWNHVSYSSIIDAIIVLHRRKLFSFKLCLVTVDDRRNYRLSSTECFHTFCRVYFVPIIDVKCVDHRRIRSFNVFIHFPWIVIHLVWAEFFFHLIFTSLTWKVSLHSFL